VSNKSIATIATMGIDIGENSFHVVGLDQRGAIVLRQKWSRGQIEARLANAQPCLIGMEACVGAHHLSRKLQAHGHDARLMPAFTQVIPLPSFSLRLGFRYAGIDRNVHNAWAYSSRAASCISKLWNKVPRQPSNLAFQFSADLIFVSGRETRSAPIPRQTRSHSLPPVAAWDDLTKVHIAWAYSSRAASCISKLWNKIPRQPSNLAFQFSADLIFVSGRGTRSVPIPRQTRSHNLPPVAAWDDLTKDAYCMGVFIPCCILYQKALEQNSASAFQFSIPI
jgi:hypothetical protein